MSAPIGKLSPQGYLEDRKYRRALKQASELMPLYTGSPVISVMPHTNSATINPYAVEREKKPLPYTVPGAEMYLGTNLHPPMPDALEVGLENLKNNVSEQPQSQAQPQAPVREQIQPPVDNRSGFEKFVQSDFYKSLQDLVSGMAAAPAGGSGWDTLAHGVTKLSEGNKQRGQVNQTVEYLKSKGYSEEEARFIAGNKNALNAFLAQTINGGNKTPQFTNDGRMIVEDPNAPGGYRYVMVEGGKAYEDNERAKRLHENNIVRKSILLKDIGYLDEYIKEKAGYASGMVAWIKSLFPGSKEKGADEVVKSIKERIASDRIDELKQLSKTGAVGLGNASDKDLDMLKHCLGALSINMNVELFTRNLNQIRDVISRLSPEAKVYLLGEDASHSSANQSSQGGSANLPATISRENIKNLAIGDKAVVLYGNVLYEITRDR